MTAIASSRAAVLERVDGFSDGLSRLDEFLVRCLILRLAILEICNNTLQLLSSVLNRRLLHVQQHLKAVVVEGNVVQFLVRLVEILQESFAAILRKQQPKRDNNTAMMTERTKRTETRMITQRRGPESESRTWHRASSSASRLLAPLLVLSAAKRSTSEAHRSAHATKHATSRKISTNLKLALQGSHQLLLVQR